MVEEELKVEPAVPTDTSRLEDYVEGVLRIAAVVALKTKQVRDRLLGRDVAFAEGRDTALCNAAMVAHDMGHPDVRVAINRLIPVGSVYKPMDSLDDAWGGKR